MYNNHNSIKNHGYNSEFNSFLNRKIYFNKSSKYEISKACQMIVTDCSQSEVSVSPVHFVDTDLKYNNLEQHNIVEKIIKNYLWKYKIVSDELCISYYPLNLNSQEFGDINYKLLNKNYLSLCNKYNIPFKSLTKERGYNRLKSLQKNIDLKFSVSCYLDIGCFDGNITESIGNYFNLNNLQIHGVDIKPYATVDIKPYATVGPQTLLYDNIIFSLYDGRTLPYSDNSFDLITCLMVLHHIPKNNLNFLLQEINRVMKPGGILILREHDVYTYEQSYLLNVMHDFYDYVWTDKPIEKSDQWDAEYKSNKEWTSLLQNNNFVVRESPNIYFGDKNPYFMYYCSYIKKVSIPIKNMFRILPNNMQRKKYHRRTKEVKNVLHWGQRKLLLSEIEFLTIFLTKNINTDKKIYVIYAGAAPGTHILYLSNLFPMVYFELYDPRDFSRNIIVTNNNINTYVQYFTDETANKWKSIDHHDKLILFISDIRTGDTETMNSDEVEERVIIDNQMQMNWYNIMKPKLSMFKFRLPYNSDNKTENLDGDIYLQAYAPATSTETRLIVGEDAKLKLYDDREFEEQLFYFNNYERVCNFNNLLFDTPINKKYGIKNNYDGASEIYILEKYLKLFDKVFAKQDMNNDTVKLKIIKMINEITKELSKRRTLFSEQPVKNHKKNCMLKLQRDGFIPERTEINQKTFDIYIIPKYEYFNKLGYFNK
jgi:SAM-dependent methyltransferase